MPSASAIRSMCHSIAAWACGARKPRTAHLVAGEREDAGERAVHVVRALERAAHEDAAVLGALGDHPVVLDVELLLMARAVLALDHAVGGGEAGGGIAARDHDLLEDVVAPV